MSNGVNEFGRGENRTAATDRPEEHPLADAQEVEDDFAGLDLEGIAQELNDLLDADKLRLLKLMGMC